MSTPIGKKEDLASFEQKINGTSTAVSRGKTRYTILREGNKTTDIISNFEYLLAAVGVYLVISCSR